MWRTVAGENFKSLVAPSHVSCESRNQTSSGSYKNTETER